MAQRRRTKLTIAVPASYASEHPTLRDKTDAVGRLARAAAIFRAEEVVIYPDQPDESPLIKLVLGYVETPQYLRKYLYKVRPELQYAGALPPLRTPHHQLESRLTALKVGEYREGVLIDKEGVNVVDLGVERPIRLTGRAPSRGSRVTVKVVQIEPEPFVEMAKRAENPTYWGFEIQVTKRTLGELATGGFYDLTIATSRTGEPITGRIDDLRAKLASAMKTLVAFGSPRAGIPELLRREGREVGAFQYTLNTIPDQGTETVRTDEAIFASLAVLNLFG